MAVQLQWRQAWNGSVLDWAETWGEGGGALEIASTSSLGFGALTFVNGALSVAAAASFGSVNSTFNAAAFNLPGSTTVLWEGTEKAQPRAVAWGAQLSLAFTSGTGSAFDIRDDQTVMSPAAGAMAHAAVVSVSSAVPVWVGSDAQDFKSFGIAATSALGFAAAPVAQADFSIAGAATVSFPASPLYGADLAVIAATAATPWSSTIVNPRGVSFAPAGLATFAPYSRAEGAFAAAPTGFVEFGQTAGAVGGAAVSIVASSSAGFGATSRASAELLADARLSGEFGQPGGGVEFGALVLAQQLTLNFAGESQGRSTALFAARGGLVFRSDNFVAEDDDLVADADPRKFWEAAAQQEAWERDKRRLRRIARIDEDDLLTLSAALSQALSQAATPRSMGAP